jgi:hypothetical protein
MKRFDIRAAVDEEMVRFEAEIRQLAYAIARAVIREELHDKPLQPPQLELIPQPKLVKPVRLSKRELARQAKLLAAQGAEPRGRRKRGDDADGDGEAGDANPPQLELHLANASTPAPSEAAPAAPPPAIETPAAPPAAPEGNKRVHWTRESIINELATWVSSGTTIDAAFMARHGPRGLVAAARKIFGRFEAAMNLTALHLSKVQAENPPSGEPS